LLVVTAPPGAACRFARDGRMIAVAAPTPAIVRGVASGSGSVKVTCERPGFAPTSVAVTSGDRERIDISLAPR
jgi:hypothetical protein